MTVIDDKLELLRQQALAGDSDAACEVGRLLCLLPAEPAQADEGVLENTWPGLPWLRRALTHRPDDELTLMLLAGRLLQQVEYLHYAWDTGELDDEPGDEPDPDWEDEERPPRAVAAAWDEAVRTHRRLLAVAQDTWAAWAGLAELRSYCAPYGLVTMGGDEELTEVADGSPGPAWDFYLAEQRIVSGSAVSIERVVTSDADELRWACDRWLEMSVFGIKDSVHGPGVLMLSTYLAGQQAVTFDLGAHIGDTEQIRWEAVPLPLLSGLKLPPGHPVGLARRHLIQYGYTWLGDDDDR